MTDVPPGPAGPAGPVGPPRSADRVEDTGPRTEAHAAISRNRSQRHVRRSRRRHLIAGAVGLVVLIGLAFVVWYELQTHALGQAGRREVVEVKSGESVGSVLDQLSADHVIGSTFAFRVFDVVHGTPSLVPGHYLLHQNQTFAEVRTILNGGPNIQAVTVEPGLTLHEVAERVDDLPGHTSGGFEKLAASGAVHSAFSPAGSNDLEGMLGTGTYLLLPGETDSAILTSMVHRFDSQATSAGLSTASAAAFGLSPYQLITAASIVEKEGYIPKNMPDVARVIYNRLAAGTPLQMNATVLYSLGQDGGAVTKADLKLHTPYNTYLNVGLTPTPICSPSTIALNAAVHPPAGGWLFFVLVKKDGTEAFADTYPEQLANQRLAAKNGVG